MSISSWWILCFLWRKNNAFLPIVLFIRNVEGNDNNTLINFKLWSYVKRNLPCWRIQIFPHLPRSISNHFFISSLLLHIHQLCEWRLWNGKMCNRMSEKKYAHFPSWLNEKSFFFVIKIFLSSWMPDDCFNWNKVDGDKKQSRGMSN